MKATKAEIMRLAKSLKEDFKAGKEKGSFADRLDRIVLGFEYAFVSDIGNIGIESKGRLFYLYTDIRV